MNIVFFFFFKKKLNALNVFKNSVKNEKETLRRADGTYKVLYRPH